MNLALVCTEKLPSPAIKGGAIQMMIDGVVPFLKTNHKLTIFSVSDPLLQNVEEQENVTYIRVSRLNYIQNVAAKLAKLPPFDVIHVFNRPKAIPVYRDASPESQFVLSLHNEMFAEKKLSDEEGHLAVQAVCSIMTVSEYIRGTVIQRFPDAAAKTHVVYSGVDLAKFEPKWTERGQEINSQLKNKNGLSGQKVILFIGRLSRTKGPHLLIQALPNVLERFPNTVLVICGGKWFSDNRPNDYVRKLHNMAKPLGEHVRFTQYVPHDKIPYSYLLGDVFVCSSQWQEPLARVHYEAMAAGIPLITTKRGGNAEVITHMHNGIVLKNYANPANFAAAICDMFDHPDKAMEFSLNGRAFVESNHQFCHVAERLETIYVKAFNEKSFEQDNETKTNENDNEITSNEENRILQSSNDLPLDQSYNIKATNHEQWIFDRGYSKRKR
ncbi:glycosyltransferase family 4 protein [Pseudalkalibacillus hwajinpoensis]|uniref:glycosyltransferase family 4 protein n=1 Tax=Guptibacillus hwajinpoensis TaxID=208199 RepID=UPI00325BE447